MAFSGAAPADGVVTATIAGQRAAVQFAGLTGAGLYQINVVVPDVPNGDQPVVVTAGGVGTPAGVFVPVGRP